MSSFLEKLLGSGPYAEAQRVKAEIQAKSKRPNGRERKELESANQLLMDRRRFLIKSALLLGAVAIGGKTILDLAGAKDSVPVSNRVGNTIETLRSDREKLARAWIDPFSKIVERSSDPLAKEVLRFVEENATLAKPEGEGLRFLRGGRGSQWFALASLTQEDAVNSKIWSNFFGKGRRAAAHFLPDKRVLLLKEYGQSSAQWKGLLFGHEAFHAYDYLSNPYDWENPSEYLLHEVGATEFENGLIHQVGGEPYQQILGDRIARLAQVNRLRRRGDALLALPLDYDSRLDSVFGANGSQFEMDLRGTHFDLDAAFGFIEKSLPAEDQKKAKMDYLKMEYQDIEGIPK